MTRYDDTLDLVLERVVPVRAALVWHAWTDPQHLLEWFTPVPWKTTACEIDLRPGGIFRTLMQGPNGESFDGSGCWLEVVPVQRLVWTSALGPGFRPHPGGAEAMPFTCTLTFEPLGDETRYTAHLVHADAAGRDKHAAMGFHDGWGKALDQLVASCAGR